MGNKILFLIYFIVDSLIFISGQGYKKNELLLGSIDVKAQAPFIMTYQESLTGAQLNLPFHYTLQLDVDGDVDTYSIYSYFSADRVGTLNIYDAKLFSGSDKLSIDSGTSGFVEFKDNNYTIQRVSNRHDTLELSYFKYIERSDVYILYSTNEYEQVMAEPSLSDTEAHHSSHPIISELRFVNGLTAESVDTAIYVAPWLKYKNELTRDSVELFERTVPEIYETVAELALSESKMIKFDRWLPSIVARRVDGNDVAFRMFEQKLTEQELWDSLKHADHENVSAYQDQGRRSAIVYKDKINVITSFKDANNLSNDIYLSISKVSIGNKTVLLSMRTATEPMARFYLSYFNYIQESIDASTSKE